MIIVGAGIIGLSLAWRLAQRGVRVTVLDRSQAAREASWAAAGMLAPGGEFESGDTGRMAVESLRLYPDFVGELVGATGCPIDFRICGTLELDPASDAELQAGLGIRSSLVSNAEAVEIAPGMSPLDAPARYYPDDALVAPRQLCHALLAACRALDVQIMEGCEVRSVDAGRTAKVETSGGVFESDGVIIAAGAWSSHIPVVGAGRRMLPGVHPVRGVLVGRNFPVRKLGSFLRRGHGYVLQRESGFAIAGTSSEKIGFDRSGGERHVQKIVEGAEALWPEFARGSEVEWWLGFRPASDTGAPHIGRFEDLPVWMAYGHFRNGILLAPATAERLACGICG